jgi:hypothetical protein
VPVRIFQVFYNWLNMRDDMDTHNSTLVANDILALYVLAVDHIIPQLQIYALEMFLAYVAQSGDFHICITKGIYTLTCPTSPLRKLYIDILLETLDIDGLGGYMGMTPYGLLADLVERARFRNMVPGTDSVPAATGPKEWYEWK